MAVCDEKGSERPPSRPLRQGVLPLPFGGPSGRVTLDERDLSELRAIVERARASELTNWVWEKLLGGRS